MTTTIDKASFGQSGYGHELSAEKKVAIWREERIRNAKFVASFSRI